MNQDKKDTLSYVAHNEDYKKFFGIEWHKKMYVEDGTYKQFENFGYLQAIQSFPLVRDLHIDIGSGGGWMLSRTAPYFKKVLGIEPSAEAIKTAKEINKEHHNVEFLQADMVEGLSSLKIEQPIFITTSTVLSHITDEWVAEFLKVVNSLPKGSILFFGEGYGKNIQRKLWHIRSKEWWAKNLPNWQLTFYDKRSDGEKYGVFGLNVGSENVMNSYAPSFFEKLRWFASGVYYKLRTFAAVTIKTILFIKKP